VGVVSATVVVSPHFDDAVLSCWHLLGSDADVQVVNVFTGAPPNGTAGWWDRLTGTTDASERVREREAEDRRALAVAGRSAIALGFLDEQYRTEAQPLEPIVERLHDVLPPGCRLAAPATLGGHIDHAHTREACRLLSDEGHDLTLYADLPGAVLFGWPPWVTGEAPDPYLSVDAHWRALLEQAGFDPDALQPEVHELAGPERTLKLEALSRYRTQLRSLRAFGRLEDPETLGYEVTWRAGGAGSITDPAGAPTP
jgi:LmbE family N-acetylglucosaminyl deacetylase